MIAADYVSFFRPLSDTTHTVVALSIIALLGAFNYVGVRWSAIFQRVSTVVKILGLLLFVALFLAMPVVLTQVWHFVAPGLYLKEKRFAFPLLLSRIALFYAGVPFAYFVVFPLMFAFFAAVAPEGVTMMTDISSYLDFILALFFAFGVAFEVPIATVMLVWSGLVPLQTLGRARAYVFLGAFVMGMLLTPPDIISQTLLAVPVYLLYEIGLLMARLFGPEASKSADTDETDDAAE